MKNYLFLFIIPWSLHTSETKSPQSSEEIIIAAIQQIENETEWAEIPLNDDDDLTTENKNPTPIKKSKKWWERNSK